MDAKKGKATRGEVVGEETQAKEIKAEADTGRCKQLRRTGEEETSYGTNGGWSTCRRLVTESPLPSA
jgi:hypothetical protein